MINMKFKNQLTNEVVEAKNYTQIFAFTHNSNWEEVKENKPKEPTVAEIKAILEDKGIAFDSRANKEELLKLLPKEE